MSVTLQTVSSGYNLSTINANFQSLQNALNNNILWRTGDIAGEAKMSRDLDMDGHALLNLGVDVDNPGSVLTVGVADLRYYNITGDVLEGTMNAGGNRITNLATPVGQLDAARKKELDEEAAARQSADANIQEQLTGNVPLEASAFSQISWHDQNIPNSVTIPANKNAWSFGPQIEIEQGQLVKIGEGSTWTIANGRVVEDEDLHHLVADTITTVDGTKTVNINDVATGTDVTALSSRVTTAEGNITSLTSRMTTEENKVNDIAHGGTGATTASTARTSLGAAASGANTDITSITGSAASLTTARTIQTNLGSASAASFNGTANITPGVTGTLPVANGGTGSTTAAAARTSLGAAASAGVTDASNAAAGVVGEYLSSDTGTSTALTTAVTANIASLSLTAGDWEVSGYIRFLPDAGITMSGFTAGPTTTSAGTPSPINRMYIPLSYPAGQGPLMPLGRNRFNVSATTTVYITANATFGGSGVLNAQAGITARRIR